MTTFYRSLFRCEQCWRQDSGQEADKIYLSQKYCLEEMLFKLLGFSRHFGIRFFQKIFQIYFAKRRIFLGFFVQKLIWKFSILSDHFFVEKLKIIFSLWNFAKIHIFCSYMRKSAKFSSRRYIYRNPASFSTTKQIYSFPPKPGQTIIDNFVKMSPLSILLSPFSSISIYCIT